MKKVLQKQLYSKDTKHILVKYWISNKIKNNVKLLTTNPSQEIPISKK